MSHIQDNNFISALGHREMKLGKIVAKIHYFDKNCGLFGICSIQMTQKHNYWQPKLFYAKSRITMKFCGHT